MSGETSGLSLTVLGCSGSYAAAGGACTGFLVQSAGATVWMDCGPGTFANLQQHTTLTDLDAIVISHHHPDHWLELPVVYSALRHYQSRSPVPVFGTADNLALAENLCEQLSSAFRWTTIGDGDTVTIGDQTWTFSQTDHYIETLASRIDAGGRSLAFTADTGPGWSIGKLGDRIHCALAEATFLAHQESKRILHLSARQAGLMAREADVDRLILTHLAPGSDPDAHLREAQEAFGGPVQLAEVGARYSI